MKHVFVLLITMSKSLTGHSRTKWKPLYKKWRNGGSDKWLTLSFPSCTREICAILTHHTSHNHDGMRRHCGPLLAMIHHKKLVIPLLIHLY
jgi:hypothetical protein